MKGNFTENDVYKALGLGEKVQEPAAPATGGNIDPQTNPTGENVQEPAAPAGKDTDTPGTGEQTGTGDGKPAEQTEQQRREHAARRRKEEQQQAVDTAVAAEREKYDSQIKEIFAKANLINPETGKAIASLEELNTWHSAQTAKKLEEDLKKGKLTPEGLQQVIDQNPVVQKVKQQQEEAEAQAERVRQAERKNKVQKELEEIQKLNPGIKSMDDLLTMPNSKEFYDLVKQGCSFVQAYKLANYDQLIAQQAQKAQAQADALARGKEHLTPTQVRGAGAVPVPSEELAIYRRMMPNASEAEIQAHYQKYKKN